MTLWIRQAAYVTGGGTTYVTRPDEVRGHVIIIASGGSMANIEGGVGEADDPARPEWKRVTFTPSAPPDTATVAGQVTQRLVDLVTSSSTFEIVGVAEDTIWSSGNTTAVEPAFALGNTLFYATAVCNGNGRWIRPDGDGSPCTPVVGILYHELAHSWHDHPQGTRAEDEAEAITDENVLRAAMGLAPRSTSDLASGCGCPGSDCCIIASVATGAPYGPTLGRLRGIRDRHLRPTAGGRAFFDVLHREYYAFSVDVCRAMVGSPAARAAVEGGLVHPLVQVLDLLQVVAATVEPAAIASAHRRGRDATAATAAIGRDAQRWLARAAGRAPGPQVDAVRADPDPALARIEGLLAEWLPRSPHVRWAIVEPLIMLADSLDAIPATAGDDVVSGWWRARVKRWLAAMPLASLEALAGERWSEELASLLTLALPTAADRDEVAAAIVARRSHEG